MLFLAFLSSMFSSWDVIETTALGLYTLICSVCLCSLHLNHAIKYSGLSCCCCCSFGAECVVKCVDSLYTVCWGCWNCLLKRFWSAVCYHVHTCVVEMHVWRCCRNCWCGMQQWCVVAVAGFSLLFCLLKHQINKLLKVTGTICMTRVLIPC